MLNTLYHINSALRPSIVNNSLQTGRSSNCLTASISMMVNTIQVRYKKRTVLTDKMEPHRVYRFDKKDGKRSEALLAYQSFYRLNWGMWIRPRGGKYNKTFDFDAEKERMMRKHVMCNGHQCSILDKMTLSHAKRRHYYPDDEYEPYHSREEFTLTRKKPLPASKNVEQFLD